jgi:hypothetical protein
LIFDQGTLDVYTAMSVALVSVFGVLLIVSLLNAFGWIRVPQRGVDVVLVAAIISLVAALVAALLAVLL